MRFTLLLIALLMTGQHSYAAAQAVTRTAIIKKPIGNCPDGQFFDQRVNRCLGAVNVNTTCPDGYQYDQATGMCHVLAQRCPPGTFYDAANNQCLENIESVRLSTVKGCPPGYVFVPATATCELPGDIPDTNTVAPTYTPTALTPNQRNMPMQYIGSATPVTVLDPAAAPMHNLPMQDYAPAPVSSPWTVANAATAPTPTKTLTGTNGNYDRWNLEHPSAMTDGSSAPANNTATHNIPMPGYSYGR